MIKAKISFDLLTYLNRVLMMGKEVNRMDTDTMDKLNVPLNKIVVLHWLPDDTMDVEYNSNTVAVVVMLLVAVVEMNPMILLMTPLVVLFD